MVSFFQTVKSFFRKSEPLPQAGRLLVKPGQVSSKDIPSGTTVEVISSTSGGGRRVSSSVAPTPSVTSAPPKLEPPTLEQFTESIGGQARARTISEQLRSQAPQPLQPTVEAVKQPTGLIERGQAELTERRFQTRDAPIQKFLAGAGLSALGTLQFGKGIITEPIKTTKETATGLFGVGKRLISGEGFPEVGRALRQEPSFAAGFIAGEVLTFKGLGEAPKLGLKASDIARTRGLKELPATQIIDPKFFAGETFPTIRRGETAGELLGEFRTRLPGETKPGGFTATPTPFPKETKALRGTSEFPGVFQAPLVSPRFLRIGGEGERKLFSLSIFDTPRPSIVRITPERIRLAPGVSPTQKQLSANIKGTQEFFEKAPKGESIIPFIKREKEAIIPFETKLEIVDKRFFIKFEGRKVPIFEFKTITGDVVRGAGRGKGRAGEITDIGKLPTIKDISRSSSRGGRRAGRVTPLSSAPFIPSRSQLIPSISVRVPPSRGKRVAPRDPFSPIINIPSISPRPSRGRTPGFDIPSLARPPRIPKRPDFPPPPTRPPRRRGDERKKKVKVVSKRKKRVTPIRVSFTGAVLGIRKGAKIKKGRVSPFEIRGLRTGRGSKLTDL